MSRELFLVIFSFLKSVRISMSVSYHLSLMFVPSHFVHVSLRSYREQRR